MTTDASGDWQPTAALEVLKLPAPPPRGPRPDAGEPGHALHRSAVSTRAGFLSAYLAGISDEAFAGRGLRLDLPDLEGLPRRRIRAAAQSGIHPARMVPRGFRPAPID